MTPQIGLIGVGRWGEKLLRVLYDLKAVGWVYTRSAEKRQHFQAVYPEITWVED
ncbi:MAG: hypothetical protein ABDH66_03475 [Bacteroidia bacterium]